MFPNRFIKPNISNNIPITGCPTNTKNIPHPKHPVARAFWGWRKYPTVRPGPISNGIPATKRRFPRRIRALLKKRVIPRTVNAAPEDRKMIPSLRLDDVNTAGSFVFDPPRRFCVYISTCFGKVYELQWDIVYPKTINVLIHMQPFINALLTDDEPLPSSSYPPLWYLPSSS